VGAIVGSGLEADRVLVAQRLAMPDLDQAQRLAARVAEAMMGAARDAESLAGGKASDVAVELDLCRAS
jgi:hypothetical protein